MSLRLGDPKEALALARAAADGTRAGTLPLAARYIEGRAALALGDPTAAEAALRPVVGEDSPFLLGARLALAEALTQKGDGDGALTLLSRVGQALSEGERRFEVAFARAAAYAAAGDDDRAAQAYRELLAKWHPRLQKDRVRFLLAEVEAKRAPERAQAILRALAIEEPQSRWGALALHRLQRPLDASETRARTMALYKAREYDEAVTGLDALLATNPRDAEVHLALGRLHGMILRDDRVAALGHLRFVKDKARDPKMRSEAAWRLAVVQIALGHYDDALATIREYKSARWGRGWDQSMDYRLARLYHEAGHAKKARKAYAHFVRRYKPRDRTMYVWFVGWTAFRGGDYKQAIADFKQLIPETNLLVGAKALYWSAEARRRLGDRDRAVRLLNELLDRFPLCYYAVLASRKLAELGSPRPLPGLDRAFPPPDEPSRVWDTAARLPSALSSAMTELRWLIAVGDAPEARQLYDRLQPKLDRQMSDVDAAAVLPLLADLVEAPHRARHDAWRRHRGTLRRPPSNETIARWRAIYPRAYRRFAKAAAAREGIPELLLYCHMLQESRFKRFAISSAPAYGVMQFLEKTGKLAARDLGLPYERRLLLDPAYDIRLGAYYLGALIRRYHGQVPLAVAAYNGGPRLMDAHLAHFGHLPFDEMVEEIDRHETRNYVRKILDHYVRYVALYLPPDERQAAIDAVFPRGSEAIDPTHGSEPSY